MRVLMLSEGYPPVIGGVERVVQSLSRELVDRGHSVAVATLTEDAATGDDGVRVHRLRSTAYRIPRAKMDTERVHATPLPDPETTIDLKRVIETERPDIVHAHNWLAHSFLPLKRRSGAALVVTLHDYGLICANQRLFRHGAPCDGPGVGKCIECAGRQYGTAVGAGVALTLRGTGQLLRRMTDIFLPVSEAVRVLNRLPENDHVRVIYNFQGPLPDAPDPTDPRLAALPSEPYVLFFGDATPDKGAAHLAEVYATLESPPPLVFVGRCFIDSLHAQPGVVAIGPLPHPLAIEAVRRSMFTVAPSLWAEPCAVVALETAAAGKPMIASDIGGLTDLVADGETGFLVAPGDRASLRAALTRLLSDEALRDRMTTAALARSQQFAPQVVVPRFEAAYAAATQNLTAAR